MNLPPSTPPPTFAASIPPGPPSPPRWNSEDPLGLLAANGGNPLIPLDLYLKIAKERKFQILSRRQALRLLSGDARCLGWRCFLPTQTGKHRLWMFDHKDFLIFYSSQRHMQGC